MSNDPAQPDTPADQPLAEAGPADAVATADSAARQEPPAPSAGDTGPLTPDAPAPSARGTAPLVFDADDEPAADVDALPEPAAQEPAGPAWWEASTPFVEEAGAPDSAPAPDAAEPPPPAPVVVALAEPPAQPPPAEPEPPAETAPPPEPLDGTRQLTHSDVPALTALRSRQGLAAAALRDIGRVRSVNQDSVYALVTTLPRESSDLSMGLFVVADGMGGHDGGEVASRLAVGTVARLVLSDLVLPALAEGQTEALQPLIVSAVQEANRAIWEHARSIGSDMGTTCTAVMLMGSALYIGHVGDSRAYLRTPVGLRAITGDHSAVGRLIQLGQLDPADAREHPLRSHLYRTVGQQPEVLVDFIYQPIGDATHLLLCSDGLWGMLDEAVILDVLEHSVWPQDACRELIALANLAGGEDNISAVVVTLPTQG